MHCSEDRLSLHSCAVIFYLLQVKDFAIKRHTTDILSHLSLISYVCVCMWLSDAVNISDCLVLNDWMVGEKWIRMCKEVVIAKFEVLF